MLPKTLDELVHEFDELGDWEAKCETLIDIGLEVPRLDPTEKIEPNRVHGCQSNVWMIPQVLPGQPPRIDFRAESDAMIVNGLIAVLKLIYSGKTAEEILQTDVHKHFHRLGLDRQLSSQRRNGLFGMVQRIYDYAKQSTTA